MALVNGHRGEWKPRTAPGPNGERVGDLEFFDASRPLTEGELAALRTELRTDPARRGYAGKSPQAVADLVNGTYLGPNPDPAPRVKKPMGVPELSSLIPAETLLAFMPAIALIRADVERGDREAVRRWAQLAVKAAKMTAPEYGAIVRELDAEVPDPSHPKEVIQPSRSAVLFTAPPLVLEPADILRAQEG